MREPSLSSLSPPTRAKPWKELIDVHENSGSNREKKNLQGRVLVVTAVINELIVVNFYLFTQGFKPPMLIFVQSRERAKELFHELIYDGINVDVIHSDRTQAQVRFL